MFSAVIQPTLFFAALLQAPLPATHSGVPPATSSGQNQPVSRVQIAPEMQAKLLNVKRIYIDSFGDDGVSKKIQAMLVTSLTESKQFVITENKEKADAVLKGTATEQSHQEFHALNDKAAASTASGGGSGSLSGSFTGGTGTISGSSSSHISARSMAADDSVAYTETINESSIAVRLVAADGDVIWTSTQESKGAKYKSASADAASKVIKQLLRDLERLQEPKPSTADQTASPKI